MAKRIAAFIGLGLIAAMYIIAMISAILAKPNATGLFMASVGATIIVPMVIWIFIMLYKRAHKDDDKQITLSEYKRYNKRIKQGEDPQKIAEEIDKKYNINKTEDK